MKEDISHIGDYKIICELGVGSVGRVVLAERPDKSKVAIKIFNKNFTDRHGQKLIEMFKTEFSLLKDLSHPGINKVYDFGFDETNKQYFFTTEYIGGNPFLACSRRLSIEQIEDLFVQVLRALEYLHAHGIIHCDIKSHNVLVTETGEGGHHAQLIDFGLATLGSPEFVGGTPSYMAPEVVSKNHPDKRADLYSLGVLLFCALTNFNPFYDAKIKEVFYKQLNVIPKAPSTYNPNVPQYLDNIILNLLKKIPSERFSSASHVIRALNAAAGKNYPVETKETFLSYLPTEGQLIGRSAELKKIHDFLLAIKTEDAATPFVMFIEGNEGVGKKRLLKEVKYKAQLCEMEVFDSILEFNHRIFEEAPSSLMPALFICADLENFLTGSKFFPIAGLLQTIIKRVKTEYSIFNVRKIPKVAFAFTAPSDKVEFFMELLEIAKADVVDIKLNNFTLKEVSQYVADLTGAAAPPAPLVEGLYKRTQGNPFFITEELRTLIEQGIFFDNFGRWNLDVINDIGVHFEEVGVPPSLNEALSKRFGSLSVNEKAALAALSIWNRPASQTELAKLAPQESLRETVIMLLSKEIVGFDPLSAKYYILNKLFRDFIYEKLDSHERESLHEAVVAYIEKECAADINELLWHKGHVRNLKTAIDSLIDLGCRQIKDLHPYEAIITFGDALKKVAKQEYRRNEILIHIGEVYTILRRYDDAINTYSSLLKEEETSPTNFKEMTTTCKKLGIVYLKNDDIASARKIFDKAKKYLEKIPDELVLDLDITNMIARTVFLEGHYDEAIRLYQETKKRWQNFTKELQSQVLTNDLAYVFLQKGDLDSAEREFTEHISFLEWAGAKNELKRAYYAFAELLRQRDQPKRAGELFEKSIAIAKELSDTEMLLRAYNGMGNVLHAAKEYEKASHLYERAMDLALRTGEETTAAGILLNIGIICSENGKLDNALEHFRSSIRLFSKAKKRVPIDNAYFLKAHLEMANIHHLKNDLPSAEKELTEAEKIMSESEGLEENAVWIEKVRNKLAEAKNGKIVATTILNIYDPNGGKNMTSKQFGYILEINKYLAGETDPTFVLKTVLKYALELSGARSGLILLLNEGGLFTIQEACNIEIEEHLSKISSNIARTAVERDEIIITNNAVEENEFKASESVIFLNLKSVMCIPIRARKKAIGVMYLEDRTKTSAFSSSEKEVLMAFADQAGIAIENARLIKKYENFKKRLEVELTETSMRVDVLDSQVKKQTEALECRYRFDKMVSVNKKMQDIFTLLEKIAVTDLSVCICGESGTGKELAARALHYNSPRAKGPFVAVNCGAIPATLVESELFGYKAGAFTGAVKNKMGFFEAANGGTIFLDEIADLDLMLQTKLLRVLQEHEITRVGDTVPIKCNVRVVSAGNRDVEAMMKEQKFREDLFYRIGEVKVIIPPLRERLEDIPILIEEFLGEHRAVEPSFIKACMSYSWPGNVRELENTTKVASVLSGKGPLSLESLPTGHALKNTRAQPVDGPSLFIDGQNKYNPLKSWGEHEAEIIATAFKQHNLNARETANTLKIALPTVYKKIKELDLKNGSNPLFITMFKYVEEMSLKDYAAAVFRAAWEYSGKHPYQAIKLLKVSQGFFYKTMKKWK